jgi:nucleotide-binding universal stress UspA family protein
MRVVIAIDGSHVALRALRTFLGLAKELAAVPEVHLVSVADYIEMPAGLAKAPPQAPDLLASEAETALAAASELARELGAHVETSVLHGHVVDAIVDYARRIDAHLIVAGTHGRKGFQRAVLGSTCEGLLRRSDVPVLSVRHG